MENLSVHSLASGASDSPLKEHINAERYKISDDDVLKVLCGLK